MKGFISIILCCFSIQIIAAEQAQSIFKQLAPSLYQIKIIDLASDEKASIGSGFQITVDGLIATNYHVISSYARHPEKFKMQYVDHLGEIGDLNLESVDVINDLALVKRHVNNDTPFFTIAHKAPTKGEELFSLGNPHDLGMIVVPGTYNGLKTESFNDRIHFTGSVNPGMSGGPVVNKNSEVVGINVATSGNQIGFLVPHDKLLTLFKHYQVSPPVDIKQQMAEQLSTYQQKLIDTLVDANWQIKQLGLSVIPTIDVPFIRCWGNSNADKKEALIFSVFSSCTLDENTYLEASFLTGNLDMEFNYLEAKDISDDKFYNLYSKRIARVASNNKAGKVDVTEFECQHDIVENSTQAMVSKMIFCTRAYKDFPKLYDVVYLAASVDKKQQAMISHFTISGVEQSYAKKFTTKFMEAISWEQ
jgi:hypothetical protein